MKIYTGTGDHGETGLFGGQRVKKQAPQVEAYGTIDELNAHLGLARAHLKQAALLHPQAAYPQLGAELQTIQNELFVLGAELGCKKGFEERLKMPLINAAHSRRLEGWIDAHEEHLTPLREFILPSAGLAGGSLQVARAVCRRAERRVLSLSDIREDLLVYLNRLSDYLFTLARRADAEEGLKETPFQPPTHK